MSRCSDIFTFLHISPSGTLLTFLTFGNDCLQSFQKSRYISLNGTYSANIGSFLSALVRRYLKDGEGDGGSTKYSTKTTRIPFCSHFYKITISLLPPNLLTMKKVFSLFMLLFLIMQSFAQNNNCSYSPTTIIIGSC